jgi:hypothetical protein
MIDDRRGTRAEDPSTRCAGSTSSPQVAQGKQKTGDGRATHDAIRNTRDGTPALRPAFGE